MINNKDSNDDLNKFEKQMNDINQWQNNANNPGYYVGTGKVPIPVRNLFKSPIIILVIGVILAIPVIISIVNSFTFNNLLNNLFLIIISFTFIMGGACRLLKRK